MQQTVATTEEPTWPLAHDSAFEEPAKPAPVARSSAKPLVVPPLPEQGDNWVVTQEDAALWSGPDERAVQFTIVPASSYLRVLERAGGRLLVRYDGDGHSIHAGTAWVDSAAVRPAPRPSSWVIVQRATGFWSGPDSGAHLFAVLPEGSRLEVMSGELDGQIMARFPGDGSTRWPGVGWVRLTDVRPIAPPLPTQVPWGYPANTMPEIVRLQVPYRSQLDGSIYAGANCGPASAGMILEYFGLKVETQELRTLANRIQGVYHPNTGVAIEVLESILELYGLTGLDLKQGKALRRWSLDLVRDHLRAGHPVVPQLRYNLLPNREDYRDPDDHYVVLTGYYGDQFFYNDPIDKDGVGYDRVLSAEALLRAWANSSEPMAAFAVSGPSRTYRPGAS